MNNNTGEHTFWCLRNLNIGCSPIDCKIQTICSTKLIEQNIIVFELCLLTPKNSRIFPNL